MLRRLFVMLALLLCTPLCTHVAAQDLYKCKDAAGKITYTSKECGQLGLSSGGEVTGRITVTPALKAPPAPPPPPPAPPKDEAPAAQDSAAAKGASKPPERRCFTVQTAKGTATRCNDVPE